MTISELTLAELREQRARRDLELARLKAELAVSYGALRSAELTIQVQQAQHRADDYTLIVAWLESEVDSGGYAD